MILSFNFTLPLIDVVGRPLHFLFPLHNHICKADTFLFFPLVALRVVLRRVIERLIKFVVRRSRSFILLLLVIDLRQKCRFGRIEFCIDLAVDLVEVSSSVRHLVPITGAIELCTCRCITHVSNRNIPKSIFHGLREVQALINFVVDRSDFRFFIQEDIG